MEKRSMHTDVNKGSICALPPFGQQMLVSALSLHRQANALHFVQQHLSQSNTRCCLAVLIVCVKMSAW